MKSSHRVPPSVRTALSLCALVLPLAASAGGPELPPLLDRAKETAAALKACPAHLQAGAGVYALEKTGFVDLPALVPARRRAAARGRQAAPALRPLTPARRGRITPI